MDLKSHKLQQILDKVFCAPFSRLSVEQFVKNVFAKGGLGHLHSSSNHALLGNNTKKQQKKGRPNPISMDDNEDVADFNPQV